jgi:hypothetical protein
VAMGGSDLLAGWLTGRRAPGWAPFVCRGGVMCSNAARLALNAWKSVPLDLGERSS